MNTKPICHPHHPPCDPSALPAEAAIPPPPKLSMQTTVEQSPHPAEQSFDTQAQNSTIYIYENPVHATPVTNAELQVLGDGAPQAYKVGPSQPAGDQNCFQLPDTVQRLCCHYKGLWGLVVQVRYHQSGLLSSICSHKLARCPITRLLYSFAMVMECQAEYGLRETGLELGLLPESSALILSCSFPLAWIFCVQESAFTTSFAPLPLTVWVTLAKSHSLAQLFHLDA